MPTVREVAEIMSARNAVVPGKRVRLDFGDKGTILLDGVSNIVSMGDVDAYASGDADTIIRVSFANFLAMAAGSLGGTMALITGKLKIEGDMSVAMQLQSVTSQINV